MPRVPSSSPATGNPTSSSYIHTTSCNFVDNAGRTLLLRGVNLSGSSKAPVDRPSYILEDFWESAEVGGETFIGQPLNIDDGSADVHLARLRGWGFNMLRFPVTWEALEHAGPRRYDFEFMDYTVRVLRKCKEYGFKIYMDPHQDIWSRFSGGSGAPLWTLAACGIDARNLTATQSAIIHCEYPLAHIRDPATLPAMIWSTNYGRLLSQTVFTLFFAGRAFAPYCIIDGKNIQDYLQEHYIEAFGHLADRIRDAGDLLEECVIGWDSLNEPFEGLCGWDNLSENPSKQGSTLRKGTYPTPAQSLRLGMGQAQTVDNFAFGNLGPTRDGSVTIDPKGLKIWASPDTESEDGVHPRWGWKRDVEKWKLGRCVWAQHGVWDVETGFMLQDDYFRYSPETGDLVDFIEEYWKPHFIKFTERIRASHPEAIMFVQPPVFAPPPAIDEAVLKGRCSYSAHYYDGLTLVTRHWNWFNADALGLLRGRYSNTLQAVKIGEGAIRKSLREQLGMLKSDATILGQYPTIIGEIGTPFDMDKKRSYGWTDNGKYRGNYTRQEKALDASLNGADGENALNWTVWTYCADHTHDWGDGWNMEDLSLWSSDDLRERDSGRGQQEDDSIYDSSLGDSRAVLLRKSKKIKGQSSLTIAAVSSLSLTTLGSIDRATTIGHSDDMSVHRKRQVREPQLQDWHDNPYDFLTDGARAVRAFCRPWPHKVVGVPVDMKFEVHKACFRLVISVTPDDAPRQEEDEKDGPLATEIYVPLVHYACEGLVRKSGMASAGDLAALGVGAREGHRKSGSVDEQRIGSGRSSRTGSRWASSIDLPSLPSVEDRCDASTSTSSTVTGSPDLRNLEGQSKDLVDLAVNISGGRWEVDGQILKWWYDVPKEGEGKKQYTIEIKRRTGVLKAMRGPRGRSWWEKLCDEHGCVIM